MRGLKEHHLLCHRASIHRLANLTLNRRSSRPPTRNLGTIPGLTSFEKSNIAGTAPLRECPCPPIALMVRATDLKKTRKTCRSERRRESCVRRNVSLVSMAWTHRVSLRPQRRTRVFIPSEHLFPRARLCDNLSRTSSALRSSLARASPTSFSINRKLLEGDLTR